MRGHDPEAPCPDRSRQQARPKARNLRRSLSHHRKDRKPMVIMVSTEWCVPCQTMKRRIIPRVRERAVFRRVAFAMVNPDRMPSWPSKSPAVGRFPNWSCIARRPTAGCAESSSAARASRTWRRSSRKAWRPTRPKRKSKPRKSSRRRRGETGRRPSRPTRSRQKGNRAAQQS